MYECKYKIKKNKMENRINDDLSLSSSDKESDSECDNESDKGSEVSLIINFLRINFYYMDSNSLLPHFGHTLLDIICFLKHILILRLLIISY